MVDRKENKDTTNNDLVAVVEEGDACIIQVMVHRKENNDHVELKYVITCFE